MNKENQNTIVISVGGSLIVPNEINLVFLKRLRDFLLNETKNFFYD